MPEALSPEGTVENNRERVSRPFGTYLTIAQNPTLKRAEALGYYRMSLRDGNLETICLFTRQRAINRTKRRNNMVN